MCDRCGLPGSHGVTLSERPAHRLVGRYWEGTHGEAASGAIRPLIGEMKALSAARSGLWRSPIVGLTWNDRPDGFRYFVGIAVDDDEPAPTDLEALELPEMTFASSWHGPDDGGVVQHYLGMIEWVADMGMKRDVAQFHQREEYPPDVDLDAPPTLRLMIPVARD